MAEQFQNFYVTKLREACDATATTIYVDTVPAITEGTLVLEYANSTKHEIIHFTGVSGYGLTGCTRGLEGTTAQSHSAGTDVRQNLTAGIIDKIINGVITTENIANSAVTTAKINNGAVTADKIDFTTLGDGLEWTAIGGSISGNSSWKDTGTKTVDTAGLYFIKLWFSSGSSGSTKHQGKARVLIDNVEVLDAVNWSIANYAGNNFGEEFTAGIARINAGSTVKCQAQLQNWTGSINAKCWIARIA